MTTLAPSLTLVHRVEASYGLPGRILCEYMHWHDWSRWERLQGTIRERGRVREVSVQARECLRCGYGEVKLLH